MSLPTDLENASSSEHLISNSLSGNSADLERIRQWIDHQDRDVFDEHDELKRDIEICFQLLRLGDAIPIQSFGPNADLTHSASDIGSDCVGLDNINAITLQSVLSREESTSHPADFSPGRSSTRFLNPELIGTGGFGIVFSVLDQQLGITVALKILRPSKSRASDARSRFI